MEPVTQTNTTSVVEKPKPPKSQSPWALARRKFFKNKIAMASLLFLITITFMSIFAEPLTMPVEETAKINLTQIGKEPSSDHFLGTDKSGRDVFARTLHGGKTSLMLAFSITISVITLGTIVGAVAGFFGGWVDNALMRFTDFIMNFPFLLFVIVLQSIFLESSTGTLIFVISVLSWTGTARIVRSKVMAEKENEYIMSAISIGCSSTKTIVRHLLPNVMSTIIVQATITLAAMIVAETGLSFLGFGVPMNIPTWGNMLQDARSPDVLTSKWWIWIPPATVLTMTILSINFIGEGLKDAFNPKSNR
ncbi:ABC transporter permease [Cytobacillus spongiae]|jgi:peptide/nickel transport system permease protein|uniref:oligopeptide ABC transporter permease n=1 Tax=Cytobacillus spongiae TaxID=2901381 RepID=UPI001F2AE45B|nr:oligopeptide ABC transporter permease [Cytobacillus spongiae]UII57011.1 ABC transporter permease [Cytobacillus spongiae]